MPRLARGFLHDGGRQLRQRESGRPHGAIIEVRLVLEPQRPEERRKFFCDDGYHPSDYGYAAWATAMWESVLERIPEAHPRHLVLRPA